MIAIPLDNWLVEDREPAVYPLANPAPHTLCPMCSRTTDTHTGCCSLRCYRDKIRLEKRARFPWKAHTGTQPETVTFHPVILTSSSFKPTSKGLQALAEAAQKAIDAWSKWFGSSEDSAGSEDHA